MEAKDKKKKVEKHPLQEFRRYTESRISGFMAVQDHIFHLLGPSQQHASGIYREGLLKEFFRSFLPTDVSVDSGYIYSFDAKDTPTSGQLDIIVWHSAKHSSVYKGQDFVIVPPEAVICVLSVKSKLDKRDIQGGLDNLLTVTKIELTYRPEEPLYPDKKPFPPIEKFLIAYSTTRPLPSIMQNVSDYYRTLFAKDSKLASEIIKAYREIDPRDPSELDKFRISRLLPKMIATVQVGGPSFLVANGPPADVLAQQRFGPDLRRLPYLYTQANIKTNSFEKLCFLVLQSVYRVIGTPDLPMISAWIHIDPVTGFSGEDVWETEDDSGVSLIDADRLPERTGETEKEPNITDTASNIGK